MGNKMGGLTSKNVKLRNNDKDDSEGKRATVANVEFRENEFQRDRETKSAFYYGNKDGEIDQVDSSDAKTTNKNAVLQQAGSSDHALFKRVGETPTAIYYEPDDGIVEEAKSKEAETDNKKSKNIDSANLPTVEDRVKAVLEGMTIRPEGVTTRQKHEIKIRPESITRQKHEMVINKLADENPRKNILNTYSVMVRKKEQHEIPTATVTLDEDVLGPLEEGKERESQVITQEESVSSKQQGLTNTDIEAGKEKQEVTLEVSTTMDPTKESDNNELNGANQEEISVENHADVVTITENLTNQNNNVDIQSEPAIEIKSENKSDEITDACQVAHKEPDTDPGNESSHASNIDSKESERTSLENENVDNVDANDASLENEKVNNVDTNDTSSKQEIHDANESEEQTGSKSDENSVSIVVNEVNAADSNKIEVKSDALVVKSTEHTSVASDPNIDTIESQTT